MAPEGTASSPSGRSTQVGSDRGTEGRTQPDDTVMRDAKRSTGNRSVDNRMVTRKPSPVKQPASDLPRTIGGRRAKQSWTLLASPGSKRRALAMDELETLDNADLIKRRGQVRAAAVDHFGREQQAALDTLEDIEFIASRRGLEPMTPLKSSDYPRPVERRLNVRVHLEEGVRLYGSFAKALESRGPSGDIKWDLEYFKSWRDRFAVEFRSNAVMTALRMLDLSQNGIEQILSSYGLPVQAARSAAHQLANGSDLDKQVANIIQAASTSKDVNSKQFVENRVSLVSEARRLRQLAQGVVAELKRAVAPERGVFASLVAPVAVQNESATPALAALRKEFDEAWIGAELAHPVLAAFRRGGHDQPVWTINLASLTTGSIEDVMKTILKELAPKLRDIGRARALLKKGQNALDPLSLPAVVAVTRTNMFIPEGSLRDGVANDLASGAKTTGSYVVMIASFALALITLIPSLGASLGIPIGAAGIALSAYSMAEEWERYSKLTTLSNTDLVLAQSLVTEDPSLGSFVLSLVAAGFDLVPLVVAFRRLKQLRGLAAVADDAGEAMIREGTKAATKRPRKTKVPVSDTTNTAERVVRHKSAKALGLELDRVFLRKTSYLRKAIARKVPVYTYGSEKLNPMMFDLVQGIEKNFRYRGKPLTFDLLRRINPRRVVRANGDALDPDMISLLKQLPKVYDAVRDPRLLKRVAMEVWQFAAEHQITTREALEALVGGDVRRVWIEVRADGLTLDVAAAAEKAFYREMRGSPFIDLKLANTDHGAYTHMFQELVVSRALGTKWGKGGRRFRELIADLKDRGPQLKAESQGETREFWSATWNALFDEEKVFYLNCPETLGKILHTHLDLPKWIETRPPP